MSNHSLKHPALVIGGSLSGVFARTMLRQIGWEVDIFERSPRSRQSRRCKDDIPATSGSHRKSQSEGTFVSKDIKSAITCCSTDRLLRKTPTLFRSDFNDPQIADGRRTHERWSRKVTNPTEGSCDRRIDGRHFRGPTVAASGVGCGCV
jgi:hypothetical protein